MFPKRSKPNSLSFSDDIIGTALQFCIESLTVWSLLQTVNHQFKRCARRYWVLSHFTVQLRNTGQLIELRKICTWLPNLSLSLAYAPDNMMPLLDFKGIQSLSLYRRATPNDMRLVSQFPYLETLHINHAHITDYGVRALTLSLSLANLHITNSTEVTNVGLSSLAKLESLRVLHVSDCPRVSSQGLATLTDIQHLVLSNCTLITNEDFEVFMGLRNLTSLTLSPCNKVNELGLQRIASLPLVHLELRGCTLTNKFLLALSPLVMLRTLSLGTSPGGNVTTLGLAALQPLVRLESLK